MSLFSSVTRYVRSLLPVVTKRVIIGVRNYDGAKSNRLTNNWNTTNTTANYDLKQYLPVLRARSRDLARNNDYLNAFLRLCETNVIGPKGIKLQSTIASKGSDIPKDSLNDNIEFQWRMWGKKDNCSVDGKKSWRDCQRLFIRSLMQDGEVIVRKLNRGPFGLQLQFIEPDLLDDSYSQAMPDGGLIIMGVEQDRYGKPVAYHFKQPSLDPFMASFGSPGASSDRVRVDASEIIHEFLYERISQSRGAPHVHSAMLKLNMLAGYEEAELVAARVGASKMAFVIPPDDEAIVSGSETSSGEDTQLIDEVEPGSITKLQPGYDVKTFDPNHPNTAFPDFTKTMLRSIAAGLGVSYNTLTNDLENVSYSSVRSGVIQERDVWELLQEWMVEHFCQVIYEAWLPWQIAQVGLSSRDYAQALEPTWRARGFKWVDPLKDVQATVVGIKNGLTSRASAMAEQGEDVEDVFKQLAKENKLAEDNDIVILDDAALLQIDDPEDDSEDDAVVGRKFKIV